jgi:hypothetical protein
MVVLIESECFYQRYGHFKIYSDSMIILLSELLNPTYENSSIRFSTKQEDNFS